MKFWYKFLFLSVFVLAFTGCGKDDDVEDVEATDGVPYHSLDMKTDDGKVTQLQKHKVGKGVPIVIMGDGFLDKDIKEGKYRHATNKALEALFAIHPMKSLRDYFDVYEVTAVSYNDFKTFWTNPKDSTFNTAFGVQVGKENSAGGFDSILMPGAVGKAEEYAKKAIGGERIDDATIVVIVNDFPTNGVSFWGLSSNEYKEVPTGCGKAYVNLMESWVEFIEMSDFSKVFTNILLHEFGHAFAGLADEYVSGELNWEKPESGKESLTMFQNSGYYRNVSLNSDVTKSYWADFAADSRYDFEKLGCYEGGNYQAKGVYRPTDHSIMNRNTEGIVFCFNVASRVMIYKRCMKIAYGDSWEFNYEDFVKFDLEKAKAEHEELRKQFPEYSKPMSLGAPPRFVDCVSRLRTIKTTK